MIPAINVARTDEWAMQRTEIRRSEPPKVLEIEPEGFLWIRVTLIDPEERERGGAIPVTIALSVD